MGQDGKTLALSQEPPHAPRPRAHLRHAVDLVVAHHHAAAARAREGAQGACRRPMERLGGDVRRAAVQAGEAVRAAVLGLGADGGAGRRQVLCGRLRAALQQQ